ncbi:MAG: hypothetical protein GC146_01935 [Limimaricola sp.]|uniref:tetratricopeptide repeat protein n=1 Tax=Limimaricola sp. TaxID=2211665 RepID=UPI001DC94E20|nr:tetratricopeptide repeat protein [Limimaricola sp.]MBI1415958.1 hypothetical protein [Limimaricola sp.]
MRFAIVALCLVAAPALAEETCPPGPDHGAQLSALMQDLRTAPDEQTATQTADSIWRLWTEAPDAKAQKLLDDAMRRREDYDFLGARDLLDTLIAYCPTYAEGYNQRAFISFLRQEYTAALWDENKVLEMMPDHFGALSGKALTLMALGRDDEAQEVLRKAVTIDPYLKERALLRPDPGTAL